MIRSPLKIWSSFDTRKNPGSISVTRLNEDLFLRQKLEFSITTHKQAAFQNNAYMPAVLTGGCLGNARVPAHGRRSEKGRFGHESRAHHWN